MTLLSLRTLLTSEKTAPSASEERVISGQRSAPQSTSFLSFAAFALLALAGHWASNALAADAIQATANVACTSNPLTFACVYGADTGFSTIAYYALSAMLGTVLGGFLIWQRNSSVFPFAMLWCALGLLALGMDLTFGNGIQNHSALLNGAINTLSFGLLAGLLLVAAIVARVGISASSLLTMILATYAAKITAAALMGPVEKLLHGSVELWALFFVVFFSALSLHVGAIALGFARVDQE